MYNGPSGKLRSVAFRSMTPWFPQDWRDDLKEDTRHRERIVEFIVRVLAFLLFLALLAPFLLLTPLYADMPGAAMKGGTPPLTVVTLSYGHAWEDKNIEHNCAMISKSRHRYVIFTDNTSAAYCGVCECKMFVKKDCPCPEGLGRCEKKNPCEKLLFFTEAIKDFREMVLLDDDLLILKDYFLDRLAKRAQAHDFLASYGHAGSVRNGSYLQDFNSGLLFIRWLPRLDYSRMERRLYDTESKRDQSIISWFVHSYYANWDILSWKWHCRLLHRLEQDMPPEVCYTLHDQREMKEILSEMNFTRLSVS